MDVHLYMCNNYTYSLHPTHNDIHYLMGILDFKSQNMQHMTRIYLKLLYEEYGKILRQKQNKRVNKGESIKHYMCSRYCLGTQRYKFDAMQKHYINLALLIM